MSKIRYVEKYGSKELLKKLDDGEIKILHAYKQARAERNGSGQTSNIKQREREIRSLVAGGYRAEQIASEIGISEDRVRVLASKLKITLPDAVIGGWGAKINVDRVMEGFITDLSAYDSVIPLIKANFDNLDKTKTEEWVEVLVDSVRHLNWLKRALLEVKRNGK
jgi:DNA-binding CsgD family transcriptional regulator